MLKLWVWRYVEFLTEREFMLMAVAPDEETAKRHVRDQTENLGDKRAEVRENILGSPVSTFDLHDGSIFLLKWE